jgi:hypothetical protein
MRKTDKRGEGREGREEMGDGRGERGERRWKSSFFWVFASSRTKRAVFESDRGMSFPAGTVSHLPFCLYAGIDR